MRTRRWLGALRVIVLVLLGACGSGFSVPDATTTGVGTTIGPGAEPGAAGYTGHLTFAWRAGCVVPVAELIQTASAQMQVSYHVQVDRDPAGLLVSATHVRIDSINGESQFAVANHDLTLAVRYPSFVVNDKAQVIEVRGVDQWVAAVKRLGPDPGTSLSEDQLRAIARNYVDGAWSSWVGSWVAIDAIAGPHEERDMRLSLDPDRTTRVAIDSLAYADGRARLRWTETLEGDALQRLLGLRLPDLASARIAGVPVNGATRSILTTEIVTLPDTLQPVSVRMEADADTAAAGTSSHIYSGRTWTFDWSAARCKPESAPSTAVTPSH